MNFSNLSAGTGTSINKGSTEIAFFSGGPGGYYENIGQALDEFAAPKSRLSIENQSSNGGSENAEKVFMQSRAMGLVQEETIHSDDFIRDEIQYLVPLYLERMHVLYRRDVYENIVDGGGDRDLQFATSLGASEAHFLSRARISVGPIGSGTQILSSYIVNSINQQAERHELTQEQCESIYKNRINWCAQSQQVTTESTLEGALKLLADAEPASNRIDIMFTMAGAPTPMVQQLLMDQRIAMVSISPALIADLNKSYDINLRMADFRNSRIEESAPRYLYNSDGIEDVSTFGSYAFLIASSDIKQSEAREVVRRMGLDDFQLEVAKKLKANFKTAGADLIEKIQYGSSDTFPSNWDAEGPTPLQELRFSTFFEDKHSESKMLQRSRFMTFLISTLIGTAFLYVLFSRVISAVAMGHFFQRLRKLHDLKFGPFQQDDADIITAKKHELRCHLAESFDIENGIFSKFNAGVIYPQHYDTLISMVGLIQGRLRSELAQYYVKERSIIAGTDQSQLRNDYFKDYLSDRHFAELRGTE